MACVRHCVECPKCLTRYLIGFSPYYNGSYLVRNAADSRAGYALYCSCRTPFVSSLWKEDEVKSYEVSKAAHDRGYGTPEEIVQIRYNSAHSRPIDRGAVRGWRA
jgi:actin-related protein